MNHISKILTGATLLVSAMLPSTAMSQEATSSVASNFGGKDKREFRVGYTIADLDRGESYGGKLNGRWGLTVDFMRNIYVHRTPIGGMLKFGIQFGPQISYVNFEKATTSISDLWGGIGDNVDNDYDNDYGYGYEDPNYDDIYDDDDDFSMNLGRHQLVVGLGIGPTATVAPFINSSNENLARLKFRAHFNVVPAYSAIITANEDDMEFSNAFACMFAGGVNIIWRRLDIGFQYKGGRTRYKNLVDDLTEEFGDTYFIKGKAPRFATNMWTISIGLAF